MAYTPLNVIMIVRAECMIIKNQPAVNIDLADRFCVTLYGSLAFTGGGARYRKVGLVQIPCIGRNAVAAMRAVSVVNLSRFLYETRKISFDVIADTIRSRSGASFSCFIDSPGSGIMEISGENERHSFTA
jgi:hypothetical protein